MRRRAFAAGTVVAIFVVAGACSSFDAADAGTGVEAGTGLDGAADGAFADALEGGRPDSALLDAGFIPCAQRAADLAHFCDDFDGPERVDMKWTSATLDGGAIAETGAALSAPRALLLRLVGGTSQSKAFLRSNRGVLVDVAAKNHLAVSFSMRIDSAPFPVAGGGGFMHVALIEFDPPPCESTPGQPQRQIELSLYANGSLGSALKGLRDLCATDAGDFMSLASTAKPVDFAQKFRRVTLDVSRIPCSGPSAQATFRFAVEGFGEVGCQSLGMGDPFAHGTALTVQLGLFASGKWGDTAIAYDDVSVDFD